MAANTSYVSGTMHQLTSLQGFRPSVRLPDSSAGTRRCTSLARHAMRRRRNFLYENFDPTEVRPAPLQDGSTTQDVDVEWVAEHSSEQLNTPSEDFRTRPPPSYTAQAQTTNRVDDQNYAASRVVEQTQPAGKSTRSGVDRKPQTSGDTGWGEWDFDSWDSWGTSEKHDSPPKLEPRTDEDIPQESTTNGTQPFDAYSDIDGDGRDVEPDIEILTEAEKDLVLPVTPFFDQARFFGFGGDALGLLQRAGTALALTIVFSKYSLVAGGTLTFPFWLPWVQALYKNTSVKQRFSFVGLWRAKILEVNITVPRFVNRGSAPGMMTTVLVGDDSGARTEIRVEYDASHEQILVGQPAEVLVLSREPRFIRFKALKEAYLPEAGLWIANYPFADREKFLELSLEVERERQAAFRQ